MCLPKLQRTLAVALALLVAVPLFADDRSAKRALVAELLKTIDTKALTQAFFENLFKGPTVSDAPNATEVEELTPEQRTEFEAARRKQQEEMRAFSERIFARLDYVKFADEVYAPLFAERFNVDELKELIAFFKTKNGQKLVKVIPELGFGSGMRGMEFIKQAAEAAQEEIAKEDTAKHPWKGTLSDMRSLATAAEARATDTNEYPKVAFDELPPLLAPTYIRNFPKVDAWGTPYVYVSDGEHYRFVSAGADRRFEWNARQLDLSITAPQLSESLDADIIFQDGTFIQLPKEAKGQDQ
jgi:hypothetical protein